MEKGLLSISKTSSNQRNDYISIRVTPVDGESQILVEVEMKSFCNALFGKAFEDCEFKIKKLATEWRAKPTIP